MGNKIEKNKIRRPSLPQHYCEAVSKEPLNIQFAFLRRFYGLSQKEVARKMGVKQAYVSRLEQKGSDHLLSQYEKYADILRARLVVQVSDVTR